MKIANPRVKWSTQRVAMHAAAAFNLSWQP